MQCPECKSTHIRKNGINKQGKQNHICVTCDRQFIDNYQTHIGDDEKTQKECLIMCVNGMGFRGIERITGVHHTTIINWVKSVRNLLPRKTLCYSKSIEALVYSIRLLIHYLKFQEVPIPY